MANTYTLIASNTVGSGGASSVTFSSIPATYTDLVVKYSGRSSGVLYYGQMYFNGSTTSYSRISVGGDGSSTFSGSYANEYTLIVDPSTATASTFGNTEVYIPNYAGSTNKSFSVDGVTENNATAANAIMYASLRSNTDAITSITFAPDTGNFVQYSTFYLYGVNKSTETGIGSKATGGTVTTSGGYTIHTFTSTGMFTPTTSITGADVLIVAGGGGGGGYWGGGGGAGGFQTLTSQSYSSGVGYAAIVGAGGAGGIETFGSNGYNSSFSSTVSTGGGYGGYGAVGGVGGSGGGGGYQYAGGAGTSGQGSAGGSGSTSGFLYATGGGGGAGAVGGASSSGTSGTGGAGTSNSYSGSAVTYAGGGGGGGRTVNGNTTGSGGSGGGGAGGSAGGTTTPASNGQPGTANRGGGGGGSLSSGSSNDSTGGAGGSGIIIVRYTT